MNQLRAALAFTVMVIVLVGAWIFLTYWLRSKTPFWGNVVSVITGITIIGLIERGWSSWYRLWRVKQ